MVGTLQAAHTGLRKDLLGNRFGTFPAHIGNDQEIILGPQMGFDIFQ